MSRSTSVAILGLLGLLAPGEPVSCLAPPVAGPVVVPFVAPDCPYCSGHRGVEFATAPGEVVTSASAGDVTFAGAVAGVLWIVVADLPGRRVSYGHLRSLSVLAGEAVDIGDAVGTASDRLFLGVRDEEIPVDPWPLLAAAVSTARPRLVPADGTPGRPSPVVETACAADSSGR